MRWILTINFNKGYSYKIMKLHGLIFILKESLTWKFNFITNIRKQFQDFQQR